MVKQTSIDTKRLPVDKPFIVDIEKTINRNISKIKTDEELHIEQAKRKDMEYTQRLARIGATNAAKPKN